MKNKLFGEAPLLRLAVCLMAGIVIGNRVEIGQWLLPLLVGTVLLALLLWRQALLQSVTIAVCFMLLGWLLTALHKESLRVQWPQGEVRYEAVVCSEPQEKRKTMAVDLMLVQSSQKLKCYLYKDERSRSLRIGDGLDIQSRITENSNWHRGTFDYRRYLEVQGFTGRTYVASWKWRKTTISLEGLSRLERTRLYFLKLRSKLLRRMAEGEQDHGQYAVVAAMVLGDKSALTKELREVYAITGASHVLALSGLHLGIIYTLLSLLTVGRRWQMVSQMLIILCIWAFVFLVGMSTSVIRAATMLTLYALLSLGHRDKMTVNTLSFTAIVMLMVHPLSLYDVGFQMSFTAVFAILVLMPLFESVFPKEYLMSHRLVGWCWSMVAVSCAAQLGVAPLIAYYFGRFSTYFLLTNFIVIPVATLILWLSPVVLLFPSLAYLLLYIVKCLNTALEQMAAWPGASIEALHPSVLQTVMAYVVILCVTYILTIVGYRSGSRQP
ncbi:MAG: ComEC/Rec2 family competence protein [Prevotella sp.]|nr:ComEC/Rec2 family competence protein [Prevotella sp.]